MPSRYQRRLGRSRSASQRRRSRVSTLDTSFDQSDSVSPPYGKPITAYETKYRQATKKFKSKFTDNSFGHSCHVCERLWFRKDLKRLTTAQRSVIIREYPEDLSEALVCGTCRSSLNSKKCPPLATCHGFTYPPHPETPLPELDAITERLISPRVPFMQIRRLFHARGSYAITGQVINVPVDVDAMVKLLPRRTQFPVVECMAQTIHKSQGATYPSLVYNYSKSHHQQLVYVALSRVSTIEDLYITCDDDSPQFVHHKENNSPVFQELRTEIGRLRRHPLDTIVRQIVNVIDSQPSSFSFAFLNAQSLAIHAQDILTDEVLTKCNTLLLSETHSRNQPEFASLLGPLYQLRAEDSRQSSLASGTAIFQTDDDRFQGEGFSLRSCLGLSTSGEHGDITGMKLELNGKECLMICVYLNNGISMKDAQTFLFDRLFRFSRKLTAGLTDEQKEYLQVEIPIILGGDFNIDLMKTEWLVKFMKSFWGLDLKTNLSKSTTKKNSHLDPVFTRGISVEIHCFICYFSYHHPQIGIIQNNDIPTSDTDHTEEFDLISSLQQIIDSGNLPNMFSFQDDHEISMEELSD